MAVRDDRLHELNDAEFERLIVRICVRWLGEGVTPFAAGRDGGRDGKFYGTANSFPSAAQPLSGYCVLQAKHVAAPNKSCSEKEFESLLKKEYPKIKRLIKEGLCDHYIVFTNRKYTGGADEKLIKELLSLGLKSAHIIGVERLHLALDDYSDIRDTLPNRFDSSPFRFDPDDLVDVIGAFSAFAQDEIATVFQSAYDFEALKIHEKNKINGVTAEYFENVIVASSMPHFNNVELFLHSPRNLEYASLYHDSADELKQKIIVARSRFGSFDDVFLFMYEQIQARKTKLKGKRRLISILMHYMYCNCDIGVKTKSEQMVLQDVNA